MDAKRPRLPFVLTANEVLDGHVVYFDGAGWSPRLEQALVATDEETAVKLEWQGRTDITIAEPFLTTVALGAEGRPQPTHYRERIRVTGPTFHRETGHAPAEAGAA